MLKNYLKTTIRNIWRNGLVSSINILGLAIGLAVCMLIFLYVQNELSYDHFHANKNEIYRVLRTPEQNAGRAVSTPMTSGPYGPSLQQDFPDEIKTFVRFMPDYRGSLVQVEETYFRERGAAYVDSNFFEVFSFDLIKGDPSSVLDKPDNILISEEMAQKYFGDGDPIGQIMTLDDRLIFSVSGIFADVPDNSHLQFDFLIPISNVSSARWFNTWWNNAMSTYLVLHEKVNAEAFSDKFPAFMDKYFGQDFERMGTRIDLNLQPFNNVYFDNFTEYDHAEHGDKRTVYLFGLIALFILGIACINFMNLSTARSALRAREVGVRKTIGASRQQIIGQFFGEAIIITAISTLLAVILVEAILPYFNHLFELDLSLLRYSSLLLPALLGIVLIVGLAAGSYPAFFLSSFRPVEVLKGTLLSVRSNTSLRKGLVVLQFSLSTLLIIGTIVIFQQLRYISDRNLGFDKEQVVLIRMTTPNVERNSEQFKERLLQEPLIKSASYMSGVPGGFHDQFSVEVEGRQGEPWTMRTIFCDEDYAETFGIEMLAGRDLSREFGMDLTRSVMVNETAIKQLGWSPEEALGKQLVVRDTTKRQIIGVVKDFNYLSLKENIAPLIIAPIEDQRVMAIKIDGKETKAAIERIQFHYAELAGNFPFEYEFFDKTYAQLYEKEQRQQSIMIGFAALAILIACLGLFALAMFMAERRNKEIGIRKVLGASVTDVLMLLNSEFSRLVLIAFVIAVPVGWYAMNLWLKDFAYRIALGWQTFLIAGIIMALIAWLTVSYQSLRAALANPVNALKDL